MSPSRGLQSRRSLSFLVFPLAFLLSFRFAVTHNAFVCVIHHESPSSFLVFPLAFLLSFRFAVTHHESVTFSRICRPRPSLKGLVLHMLNKVVKKLKKKTHTTRVSGKMLFSSIMIRRFPIILLEQSSNLKNPRRQPCSQFQHTSNTTSNFVFGERNTPYYIIRIKYAVLYTQSTSTPKLQGYAICPDSHEPIPVHLPLQRQRLQLQE